MPHNLSFKGLVRTFAVLFFCTSLAAEENTANMENAALDNVTIIGHQRDPADVPGSAHLISAEELDTFLQTDIMRVLRTVPGVYRSTT